MNFSIAQAVGNLTGASSNIAITITPKNPGSVIWLAAVVSHNATASFSSTAGNVITPIGAQTQIGTTSTSMMQAVIEQSLFTSDTIKVSSSANVQGLVAVELDGLTNATALTFLTVKASTGGSNPYFASSGASTSVSGVPLAALAFCWDASSAQGKLSGAWTGWTAQSVTWQGTPPSSTNAVLEYQEVESNGTVTAQFGVTNTFDSYGIMVGVFAESLESVGASKNTALGAPTTNIPFASRGASVSTALGFPGLLLPAAHGHNKVTGLSTLSTQIPIPSSGHSKSTGLSTLTNWASVTLATPLYTGRGSILAPGSPWSNGAPAAGDTIYYDPTNLTVYSNGEVTGASDFFKAQVEWLPSPGVSSALTVQFSPFASTGTSVSRGAASLTTSIPLVSKSVRVSSGVAGFSVAAAFRSQGHAVSTGFSGLITGIALRSAGYSRSRGAASMLTAIPLSSHASNRSAGVAAMTSSIALASKGASVVLTHAAPFTAIALRSIGQSVSRGTGDQRQLILFTSGGRSVSAGAASLLTHIPLASVGAAKSTSLGFVSYGAVLKSRGGSRSTGTASISTGIALASQSRHVVAGTLLQIAPSRFGWAEITALSQTGVQSVESAYIEDSACYIEAAYFDQDDKPFVPTVVSYRVDDVLSGQNLVPWTSVEPAQVNEIAITSSQNYMVSVSRDSEEHQVLFQITDGFGNVAYERVLYSLIRVPGIG